MIAMQHPAVEFLVLELPKTVRLLQLLVQEMGKGMVVLLVEPSPQLKSP